MKLPLPMSGKKSLIILVVLTLTFLCQNSVAQNYGRLSYLRNNPLKKYPSFGFGGGAIFFRGDYGSLENKKITPGVQLELNHRFSQSMGFNTELIGGYFNTTFKWPAQYLDFKTRFFQFDASLQWYLNPAFIPRKRTHFHWFLSAGPSLMYFEPYGNLLSKDGQFYFYWSDKTIRNEPEGFNPDAEIISKDKTYETRLDSAGDYSHITLVVNYGGGVRVNLSKRVDLVVQSRFFYCFTDYIDHTIAFNEVGKPSEFNKAKDTYVYNNVALLFNFGENKKKRYVRRKVSIPMYRYW